MKILVGLYEHELSPQVLAVSINARHVSRAASSCVFSIVDEQPDLMKPFTRNSQLGVSLYDVLRIFGVTVREALPLFKSDITEVYETVNHGKLNDKVLNTIVGTYDAHKFDDLRYYSLFNKEQLAYFAKLIDLPVALFYSEYYIDSNPEGYQQLPLRLLFKVSPPKKF